MAKQPADRRQALAQGQRAGGIRVSEVVDPHVVQPGLLLDPPPVVREAGQSGAIGLAPRSTQGTSVGPLDAVEHLQDRPGQRHHAGTCLRIAQAQHPRGAVDIVPFQGEDLVRPAAGQHQQAGRRDRGGHHRTLGLKLWSASRRDAGTPRA